MSPIETTNRQQEIDSSTTISTPAEIPQAREYQKTTSELLI